MDPITEMGVAHTLRHKFLFVIGGFYQIFYVFFNKYNKFCYLFYILILKQRLAPRLGWLRTKSSCETLPAMDICGREP